MALLSIALAGLLISSFTMADKSAFVNELEHIMVDAAGYNDAGFKRGVTPCSFYNNGPQTAGRASSAQWMRVAFHDFATADVVAGTGGMDGSIGFETDREENHGAAMNDSLQFFAPFVNKYASISDMIALGTVVAVGTCNGPLMPFKGGRVDATQGGPFGVPEPQGDLPTHLARFATAGMNQTEAIELTACGHTIGSVHQGGFPDIVQNAITPNNTNGGIHFDDTGDVFDNHVATGYLDGTTPNPLVVSFNATVRSDGRLYNSDNNITMKRLASSPSQFANSCTRILTKMLNTVPSGVQLTDVTPMAIKPVNTQLFVDALGNMQFNGAVRLLSSKGFPNNPQRDVTISYKYRNGKACKASEVVEAIYDPNSTKGSSLYGDTFYHLFKLNIDPRNGISSFTVTICEGSGGKTVSATYAVQDEAFFSPTSSLLATDISGSVVGTITAAVLQSIKPSSVTATLSVPVAQIGAQNPKITTFDVPMSAVGKISNSGYILYATPANATIPGVTSLKNAFRSTVDIITVTKTTTFVDDFRKLSVLNLASV